MRPPWKPAESLGDVGAAPFVFAANPRRRNRRLWRRDIGSAGQRRVTTGGRKRPRRWRPRPWRPQRSRQRRSSRRADCVLDEDCPEKTQACRAGVCEPVENPACNADEQCVTPGNDCQLLAGAFCAGGACHYLDAALGTPCAHPDLCVEAEACDGEGTCVGGGRTCTSPPPPACSAGDDVFVSFLSSGTCEPSSGDCVYREGGNSLPELCRLLPPGLRRADLPRHPRRLHDRRGLRPHRHARGLCLPGGAG